MSSADRVAEARELLSKLKQRLISGEIDGAIYDQLRERLLADLTASERAELGVSSTPQPLTPAGTSPRPGAPLATPGPTPLGPAGGYRGGLKTHRASLADLDLQPGTELLGQWRLVRELGRGGFGAVFEAEELHLHERQAIKVLDPAMVAKEELLARFRREVSLMRKLVHPRIVRVYDYREDLDQSLALISMELVAEGSVKQLVVEAKRRNQPIPLPLALEVVTQILEALAEAHGQGVIHRDVTPGNVLLAGGTPEQLLAHPDRDPKVKLVDFGIAGLVERTELSQKSRVLGTAAYVAPEVLDPSVEVTPAADVYGAGAMGYELVTGHLPVGRFDEPIESRPELGRELNRFFLALLATRPETRPTARAGAGGLALLRQAEERRKLEEQEASARQAEEARQRQLDDDRKRREAEQRRLEAQRQAELEAAQREKERERQRQEASLKEKEDAERRAAESARAATAERQRQAAAEQARQAEAARQSESARLAEEARRLREAPPRVIRSPPSMEASVRSEARRRSSAGTWIAIATVVVLAAMGISWGIEQKKAAERARAQAAAQQKAAEAAAAEAARKQEAESAAEAQRREQIARLERSIAGAIDRSDEAGVSRSLGSLEALLRPTESSAIRDRATAWLSTRAEQRRREAEQVAVAAAPAVPPRAVATPEPQPTAPVSSPKPESGPAGLRWVRIPAGSFTMGCTSGDAECFGDENPAHRVTVRGFQMAETETTVSQYQACVSAGRCKALSGGQAGGDHPVVNVDWNESKAYCEWAGGRLPSESEWEYAARGGREGWRYPWGNSYSSESANGSGTGGRDQWSRTSPIKSFAANGFGLFDMTGNVWEWVADPWHSNYIGAPSDGSVWSSGGDASHRVVRGGSWDDSPRILRVSYRGGGPPDLRLDALGFRCARTEIP